LRGPGFLFLVVALATGCVADTGSTDMAGQTVGLLEYMATAPAEWVPTPTATTMRLAEFTAPGSGGADAEVVAYYFGPEQGGSVEANTQRWMAQFFDEAGNHPRPAIEDVDGGVFPTTLVSLEGSYARSVGMGGTSEDAVPDQMLLAAVVETPRGNLYLQMHGSSATVRAQRDRFLSFVRTVRPQASGGAEG